MKKIFLFLLMFAYCNFSNQTSAEEPITIKSTTLKNLLFSLMSQATLPTDIKGEIVKQVELFKTIEEFGQVIRNIRVNKQMQALVDGNIEIIINTAAQQFNLSPLLVALYIGSQPAMTWFHNNIKDKSPQQSAAILKQAIALFSGSQQSKNIINLLQSYGPFEDKDLSGDRRLHISNDLQIIQGSLKNRNLGVIFLPEKKMIDLGITFLDRRHLGFFLQKDSKIVVYGKFKNTNKIYIFLLSLDGTILASYGK